MNLRLGSPRSGSARNSRAPWLAWPLLLLLVAAPGLAGPYIWDQDGDHLDDRAETVNLLGFSFSFENADTTARQRIAVERVPGGLAYGVYVVYDHAVTPEDLASLSALGMPVLHRLEAVPAVRSVGSFLQAQAAASLPGVERVEAVPVLHPLLRDNLAAIGARDPSERVLPTWESAGGAQGQGVVVAILDGGVNDGAEGAWPGHESVAGGFLGGAAFLAADSTLDTPREGSVNPSDHGGSATGGHATHVAGILLGNGGGSGFARGVAPGARFVDVKVLNDAGVGTGLPEALDWCIHNAQRDWGSPGFAGIQVINLSLSSLDASDGNDLASRLAAEAVTRGIVVVASMGNDGKAAHVPSPAAGDGVLAVGALDAQRTGEDADDRFASFSNQGPRAGDGDLDSGDELKPDLLAPGVAVLSADGDQSTDGAQYRRASGTSMAAALVSGAVACLRSAYPSLTPAAITDLLRRTAWRGTSDLPPGPSGSDPRWHPAGGFGALDLYAARLELEEPGRSQVARLGWGESATTVTAELRTQRERGAAYFAIERAPDVDGSPGAFASFDSAAAEGDSSLADLTNRQTYTWEWQVPGSERGVPFWYRVAWTEDGIRQIGPARRLASPLGPAAATLEVTLAHNAYDEDVQAAIEVGGSGGEAPPELTFALPGSAAAVASDWVTGSSATGNVTWTFRIEVPAGSAGSSLPPSPSVPWWLRVNEGGYLNRSGRVIGYRLLHHLESGDVIYTGGPLPLPTIEGQSVSATIPQPALGVGAGPMAPRSLGALPNPARLGGALRFVAADAAAAEVSVFDLQGRRVAQVPFALAGGERRAVWALRDARGQAVAPGVYLARESGGATVRVVVLSP